MNIATNTGLQYSSQDWLTVNKIWSMIWKWTLVPLTEHPEFQSAMHLEGGGGVQRTTYNGFLSQHTVAEPDLNLALNGTQLNRNHLSTLLRSLIHPAKKNWSCDNFW